MKGRARGLAAHLVLIVTSPVLESRGWTSRHLVVLSSLLLLVLVICFLLLLTCFVVIELDEVLEVILVLAADVFEGEGVSQC